MDIDYAADLADKLAHNGRLWEALAPHAGAGVHFELDFFFYADTRAGGEELEGSLRRRGYTVVRERRGSLFGRTWAIIGKTPPMALSRSGIDDWTREMVDEARRCRAQFDGWGTALPA